MGKKWYFRNGRTEQESIYFRLAFFLFKGRERYIGVKSKEILGIVLEYRTSCPAFELKVPPGFAGSVWLSISA